MSSYIVTARKEKYFASWAELPPIHRRTSHRSMRRRWAKRSAPTFRQFRIEASEIEQSGLFGNHKAREQCGRLRIELARGTISDVGQFSVKRKSP
jgi:hypothetical protein